IHPKPGSATKRRRAEKAPASSAELATPSPAALGGGRSPALPARTAAGGAAAKKASARKARDVSVPVGPTAGDGQESTPPEDGSPTTTAKRAKKTASPPQPATEDGRQ